MDIQRKHKLFDLTLTEYLTGLGDAFPGDGISAHSVWSMGRYGFGLEGDELETFASMAVEELLKVGAVPAKPSIEGPDYFVSKSGYDGSPEQIAEMIISEARILGHDPDHGWHWFYRF